MVISAFGVQSEVFRLMEGSLRNPKSINPNCSGISGVCRGSSRDERTVELDTVLDLSTFSKDSWSSFLRSRRCSECSAGEDLAEGTMGSGLR